MISEVHAVYGGHFAPVNLADSEAAKDEVKRKTYENLKGQHNLRSNTMQICLPLKPMDSIFDSTYQYTRMLYYRSPHMTIQKSTPFPMPDPIPDPIPHPPHVPRHPDPVPEPGPQKK